MAGWPDYTGQQCGCIREVGLIIQVNNVAGWPDYTGQQCGCIREVGLIIQVNNVAVLERLAWSGMGLH